MALLRVYSGAAYLDLGGTMVLDHGSATGLGDDDHTQYVLADGTRAMTLLDVDNVEINGNVISTTNANGDLSLLPNGTGSVIVGNAGDVIIGDGTLRTTRPHTASKVDLGNATYPFNEGVFSGLLNANGGVVTAFSTDDVTNPPTDAELDTAFGTPTSLADGFIGILDDNALGANVYLCVALNHDTDEWWFASLTKA